MDNFENYEKIVAGYETVMNTLSSLFSVAKIKCKDFMVKFKPYPFQYFVGYCSLATSMFVTNVGDGLLVTTLSCWWSIWDVGDRVLTFQKSSTWGNHQHLKTVIITTSPTCGLICVWLPGFLQSIINTSSLLIALFRISSLGSIFMLIQIGQYWIQNWIFSFYDICK